MATDYETKKYDNIKHNKRVALVVDIYSSVGNSAMACKVQLKSLKRAKSLQGSTRSSTIALSG